MESKEEGIGCPTSPSLNIGNRRHKNPLSSNPSRHAASCIVSLPASLRPLGRNQYLSRRWWQSTIREEARWNMAMPQDTTRWVEGMFADTGAEGMGWGRWWVEGRGCCEGGGWDWEG